MSNKINLSYSKVTTILSCERRFYYQYILHLEEEPQIIPYGKLGSQAHLVLEDFYRYINIKTDNIEKEFNTILAKLYHKHFEGLNDPNGNFATGVRNFCNREIVRFNELEDKDLFMPRYSEVALEADIVGEHFRGRLDAVYNHPDGILRPTDYKFTGSNSIKLPQEIQAVIYIEMMEQKLDIYCNKYYFLFMRHGLGPTGRGYEKVIDVTDELRLKVEDLIINSVEIIEKGEYNVKSTCDDFFCRNFCPYYGACMAEEMGWES